MFYIKLLRAVETRNGSLKKKTNYCSFDHTRTFNHVHHH